MVLMTRGDITNTIQNLSVTLTSGLIFVFVDYVHNYILYNILFVSSWIWNIFIYIFLHKQMFGGDKRAENKQAFTFVCLWNHAHFSWYPRVMFQCSWFFTFIKKILIKFNNFIISKMFFIISADILEFWLKSRFGRSEWPLSKKISKL